MADIEIKNAIIKSTHLGKEDHGIMSAMVTLDYGGAQQGFGGYCLDTYDEKKKKRVGTEYGMRFIMELMAAVGVEKWEDLPGTHVRVKAEYAHIHAIGHIIHDSWFSPEDLGKFNKVKKHGKT